MGVSSRTASHIETMHALRSEVWDMFSKSIKTIIAENGSGFPVFAKLETWGTGVFFAHPYFFWDRPKNERHNGPHRAFFLMDMFPEQHRMKMSSPPPTN